MGAQIYAEGVTFMRIFAVVSRLVISVRIYHAKLVINFEEGISMTTILEKDRF